MGSRDAPVIKTIRNRELMYLPVPHEYFDLVPLTTLPNSGSKVPELGEIFTEEQHIPLEVTINTRGDVVSVFGNEECWYGAENKLCTTCYSST